jgi:hypothetical protein
MILHVNDVFGNLNGFICGFAILSIAYNLLGNANVYPILMDAGSTMPLIVISPVASTLIF